MNEAPNGGSFFLKSLSGWVSYIEFPGKLLRVTGSLLGSAFCVSEWRAEGAGLGKGSCSTEAQQIQQGPSEMNEIEGGGPDFIPASPIHWMWPTLETRLYPRAWQLPLAKDDSLGETPQL